MIMANYAGQSQAISEKNTKIFRINDVSAASKHPQRIFDTCYRRFLPIFDLGNKTLSGASIPYVKNKTFTPASLEYRNPSMHFPELFECRDAN